METEELVKKKQVRRIPAWACILLFALGFFVFMAVYATVGFLLLGLFLGDDAREPGMLNSIVSEAAMFMAVVTSATLMLLLERRPFSDLGLKLKGHAKGIGLGFLAAVLLYGVGFGISLAFGLIEVTGFQFDPLNLLVMFGFYILVALTEEIMVRGYILGRLMNTSMNKFLALFVSAFSFSMMHFFNPNVAFLPLLNILLAGMLLGASYLYTRNLCFPISLHLFWNWIQGPVLGYQVSGNNFGGLSMLKLHLPEESIMNGGAFGFEGSLICTVLVAILTILIIWWGEKHEAINLAVPRSY